jgi:hypothetical protein
MSDATGPIGCPDCGRPIARQCAGHVKRARGGREPGHRCHNSAEHGTNVCGSHGAGAPQVRAAAQRRVAEAGALALWERYSANGDGPAPVDVAVELSRLCSEVVAFKNWCGERLAALGAGDLDVLDPGTAAMVVLFERAMDRAGKLLADVSRLGIEGRLAGLTELQGRAMERVLRGALQDLGHDDRDPAIGAAVAARLRLEDSRG